MEKLLAGSARGIARAVAAAEVSALDIVEEHLARIERVNPRLNAVVTLSADSAMAAAREVDRKRGRGEPLGALGGVPFTVKDAIATAGVRSTAGSLLLRDFVPARTAPAVERLQAAGAIMLGKTNCPEFALHTHTWNRLFGATRNPLDEDVTPGGSSGGDSAAVASGCAAFGIGTDFGASTRWPAHCTGLATLRSTPGLILMTGVLPFPESADPLPPPNSAALMTQSHSISPLTRSVEDLWPICRAMAGPDGRDRHTVPVELPDPAEVELGDLACCWFEGEGTYPVRADLVALVERAAVALAEFGVTIQRALPPGIENAYPLYATLRDVDGLWPHAALAEGHEDELAASNRDLLSNLRLATVRELQQAIMERDERRVRLLEFMRDWPILLLPVATEPAYTVDEGELPARFDLVACCRVISLFDLPSAVVCCGTSDEGLPIAVQVVGRPFADHQVVAVCEALEQQFGPWHIK